MTDVKTRVINIYLVVYKLLHKKNIFWSLPCVAMNNFIKKRNLHNPSVLSILGYLRITPLEGL
jgi:uncharacterized membrane protein YwzB